MLEHTPDNMRPRHGFGRTSVFQAPGSALRMPMWTGPVRHPTPVEPQASRAHFGRCTDPPPDFDALSVRMARGGAAPPPPKYTHYFGHQSCVDSRQAPPSSIKSSSNVGDCVVATHHHMAIKLSIPWAAESPHSPGGIWHRLLSCWSRLRQNRPRLNWCLWLERFVAHPRPQDHDDHDGWHRRGVAQGAGRAWHHTCVEKLRVVCRAVYCVQRCSV